MTDQELKVVGAMKERGGGFVNALSKCFYLADPENFKKLRTTFDEYWKKYEQVAKELEKEGHYDY